MAELDATMKTRLQQLIDANRAPSSGTWASPGTAPLAAPPVALAPAPAPELQAPPLEQPAPVAAAPVVEAPAPPAAAPVSFEASLARTSQATANASDALKAEGDARAQGLVGQADIYQRQGSENAQAEQQFAAEQDERKADYEETKKQLAFMNEQNARVNQVTDRRSTTQKVMGVLAIALGGIGDGLARLGGNTQTDHAGSIVQQLNGQIARDIELQKTNIDGRNKTAAMKLTELGLARTALGDAQEAETYVTSQRQLRFASELKSQASKSGSELAKKEMLTAAAKLELDAAEKQSALQERLTEQKYRSRALGAQAGAGAGGGFSTTDILRKFDSGESLTKAQMAVAIQLDRGRDAETRARDQAVAKQTAGQAKQDAAQASVSMPGFTATQPPEFYSPAVRAKGLEIGSGIQTMKSTANALMTSYKEMVDPKTPAARRDALRAAYAANREKFINTASTTDGQGVVKEAEYARWDAILPPPPPANFVEEGKQAWEQAWGGRSYNPNTIATAIDARIGGSLDALKVYGHIPGEQKRAAAAPSGGAAPQASAPSGMVKMVAPDGRTLTVPEERVADLEAKGAKRS